MTLGFKAKMESFGYRDNIDLGLAENDKDKRGVIFGRLCCCKMRGAVPLTSLSKPVSIRRLQLSSRLAQLIKAPCLVVQA